MRVKKIPIRFRPGQQIDVTEQGEDRTVALECILPPDFEHVTHGSVTFVVGTQASEPYLFPGDSDHMRLEDGKLLIAIWPALTRRRFLRLIVTGHTSGGKQPVTPLSELLRFSSGEAACTDGGPLSAIEELRRLNAAMQEQLDDLWTAVDAIKQELADTAEIFDPTN